MPGDQAGKSFFFLFQFIYTDTKPQCYALDFCRIKTIGYLGPNIFTGSLSLVP